MTDSFIAFQPARSYEEALERAAELWGVAPDYTDVRGKRHVTPAETKKAILNALGVSSGTKEELDQGVEERVWRDWSRLAPPVVVLVRSGAPLEFPLHVPSEAGRGTVTMEIRWEEGGTVRRELSIEDLKECGRAAVRGGLFVRRAVLLPGDAPLGYHEAEVRVEAGSGQELRAVTRLIVCPDRAYLPPWFQNQQRAAGVAISLYGVRSRRNWGCGDLTDLEGVLDWLAEEAGASFVGLNPLHAIPNRQPFNTSPYLPTSIFYKNPIYLDVERLEDFQNSGRAQRMLAAPEIQAELEALRSAEYVEYERVYRLKLRALKLSFAAFLRESRRGARRAQEFQDYMEREGELLDRYAVYSALDGWIHRRQPEIWVWPDWPEEYRDPESEATRRFAKRHWRAVLFYKYVQWQLDVQLRAAQESARRKGLAIGLYHDMPLATDRCGGDLWAYRPFYAAGCRVGAPPDDFSPKGQDWSFPPPNSELHRETGYRLFTESIRKNCRYGGALRVDHVMRFFRLFWIPEGKEPTDGAYVREFHEELLPILALESVRHKVIIVGEDLGTVTPEIRAALDRYGLLGYKVPYFEKNSEGRFRLPEEYPEEALVSSTTHDLPTLAGFWRSRDIEARREAGLIDEQTYQEQLAGRAEEKQKILTLLFRLRLLPEWVPRRAEEIAELTGELHNAVVGFLAMARSRLMVLTQEDLLKETEQQNLPASTWQYPNWRRKMKFGLEELRLAEVADCTTMFRHWLEKTGRMNRRRG